MNELTFTLPSFEIKDFPDQEFVDRIALAQHNMKVENLDAIVVTTPEYFFYFSGYSSDFWQSPTRPWFLVIPADQELIAVIPSIGISAFEQTIIKNIHSWQSPNPDDDGISLLTSVLQNLTHKTRRIGFELGQESTLRMPQNNYQRLLSENSKLNFVNASTLLWSLRGIKSENEISRIKTACAIGSCSFNNMINHLKVGDTEYKAAQKMRIDLLSNGADNVPFISACSGKEGYFQIISGSKDIVLDKGSILFLDTGAVWQGYFCDFNRNFGFESINDKAKKAYDIVYKVIDKALMEIRPNLTCKDLYHTMAKELEKLSQKSINSSVGRLGHGLGLQLTEPPSLSFNDETLLQEGMVITIEPSFEYEEGKMIVLEENIVIRDSSYELLTERAPKELPIISSKQ